VNVEHAAPSIHKMPSIGPAGAAPVAKKTKRKSASA
jgi:hypothetical protein